MRSAYEVTKANQKKWEVVIGKLFFFFVSGKTLALAVRFALITVMRICLFFQGHLIFWLQPASSMTWRVWTRFLILIVSLTLIKAEHSQIRVESFIWDEMIGCWLLPVLWSLKSHMKIHFTCSYESKCWFFILFKKWFYLLQITSYMPV